MTASLLSPDEHSPGLRVSISARLIPAFSYAIAAAGAAFGSILISRVMEGMRMAESAGLAAVAGGIREANLAVLIILCLAIIVGIAGIVVAVVRLIVPTVTASPSTWFFLIGGVLGLVPVALLWQAESVLIQALWRSGAVVYEASTINLLLTLTLINAAVSLLLLLAGSVWPVSSRLRTRWLPLVALVILELALIAAAVAFQLRNSWLYQVVYAGTM